MSTSTSRSPSGAGPSLGQSLRRVLTSTIGLKIIMAVTGVAMVAFVLQHMLGHLQVLGGREAYNDYAAFMQGLGGIKWAARLGLLGVLVGHVLAAATLDARNRAARPRGYETEALQRTTVYGRAMLLTGLVVLAFLAYHLAHFTLELVDYQPLYDSQGRRDVYTNFVRSFQSPRILVTYLLATAAVGMHLAHAIGSMVRTLGLARGRLKNTIDRVGLLVALVTAAGFALVPLACLAGLVEP